MKQPNSNSSASNILSSILLTGLLAGTLDIVAAFISSWLRTSTTPDKVLQFVASGVFGTEAFAGGSAILLAGLLFHYLIAGCWSALFFLLYPKVSILRMGIAFPAIVYGVFVWLIMNQVVLPLSNAPKFPFNLTSAVIGTWILVAAIGLPNVLLARKHFLRQ